MSTKLTKPATIRIEETTVAGSHFVFIDAPKAFDSAKVTSFMGVSMAAGIEAATKGTEDALIDTTKAVAVIMASGIKSLPFKVKTFGGVASGNRYRKYATLAEAEVALKAWAKRRFRVFSAKPAPAVVEPAEMVSEAPIVAEGRQVLEVATGNNAQQVAAIVETIENSMLKAAVDAGLVPEPGTSAEVVSEEPVAVNMPARQMGKSEAMRDHITEHGGEVYDGPKPTLSRGHMDLTGPKNGYVDSDVDGVTGQGPTVGEAMKAALGKFSAGIKNLQVALQANLPGVTAMVEAATKYESGEASARKFEELKQEVLAAGGYEATPGRYFIEETGPYPPADLIDTTPGLSEAIMSLTARKQLEEAVAEFEKNERTTVERENSPAALARRPAALSAIRAMRNTLKRQGEDLKRRMATAIHYDIILLARLDTLVSPEAMADQLATMERLAAAGAMRHGEWVEPEYGDLYAARLAGYAAQASEKDGVVKTPLNSPQAAQPGYGVPEPGELTYRLHPDSLRELREKQQ